MRLLTDLLYLAAAVLYLPFAIYNAVVLGKNRNGWGERFGRLPDFEPSKRRIWMHAVSLGEVNATSRITQSLSETIPEAQILISTTTDTGYRRAVELYGPQRVFRFPLDFSLVMRRVFAHLQPTMIVLVELEVWPNMVMEASRQGIPIVVVNGRLTQRSAKRLAIFGRLIRRVFSQLTCVCAQDESIAARFRSLGVAADKIEITGSVKWDTALVADRVEGDVELALALGVDHSRPVLVCGSTGNDEEKLLLDAYAKLLTNLGEGKAPQLLLVPRKPERFDEVAGLVASRGYACIRRSRQREAPPPPASTPTAVILGDTMGELRKFYSLADMVFVGRSLVPMGGSDPMEAAGLGKPILIGPHTDNFQQPVEALLRGDALAIVMDSNMLVSTLQLWLTQPDQCKERGRRGQQIVRANQGATQRTVARLMAVLDESCGSASLSTQTGLSSTGRVCYNPASGGG